MSFARERAKMYIDRVPASGLSSKDDPKEFDALVGAAPKQFDSRQDQMEASGWQMTFCNEFAGEFGRFVTGDYMGILNNFEHFILSGPKAYSWIPSAADVEPKYGDIFFVTKVHTHLGVSRGVVGKQHRAVQGGQSQTSDHQDFLKLTEEPWVWTDFVGWCDIDLYVDGPPESSPVGNWTVWGDHRRYRWTYTFNENHSVRWVDVFNGMHGDGTWSQDGKHLVIRWLSGSTDQWNLPMNFDGMTGIEYMKGEGNLDIQASKQQ